MADYDTVGGGASGAASGAMSGAMAGAPFGPIGMVAGALIGGLFGKKKTKVPKPPTYSQMMNYNLDAQAGVQGKLLGLESTYRPQYQALQERTLNNQLYGGNGTEGYIGMLNDSNNALLGVQSQYAQNYMSTLGGLTQQARGVIESPANAAMHAKMMGDARNDLSLGSSLNSDEQRMAYQNANQAMAMRGMTGRQGVAAGVLANYGLGQQRLGQRRQFAATMMGAETALQNAALQAGQGSMAGYGSGGKFMAEANTMLGQYQPQIFQPESQMGTMAQGMQYQHGMGIANAQLQQQAQLMKTMQQFGSSMMTSGLGNFGSSPISSLSSNTGYGANLSTSQMAGGFNNTLGGGGSNLNFSSGPMYSFR